MTPIERKLAELNDIQETLTEQATILAIAARVRAKTRESYAKSSAKW